MENHKILSSSFRDPSGFLFYHNKILHRQINSSYKDEYDTFLDSGLYDELVNQNLLISHEEVKNSNISNDSNVYKIIWLRNRSISLL